MGDWENLDTVNDLLWRQFAEDRRELNEIYQDLKNTVKGSPESYAVSGDTLAKYAELLLKQTAQVLDFSKAIQKIIKSDDSISPEDLEEINSQIEKDSDLTEPQKPLLLPADLAEKVTDES